MLSVIIHGGAGRLNKNHTSKKLPFLKNALDAAWTKLCAGATGEEAVVSALRVLEECEYFNAGYGGYPNSKGIVLLDVGLMNGARNFASLINIRRLKYPSEVALDFLKRHGSIMSIWTHELMLQVDGATQEVKDRYGWVATHEELIAPFVKKLMDKVELGATTLPSQSMGTVGCVVRDRKGNLCAGTSTGGVNLKANGRVGDTPVIGSGVFADNETCALSTSGHGEAILLSSLSGFIIAELRKHFCQEKKDLILKDELEMLLRTELLEFARKAPGKSAGVIVIPKQGPATFLHHSPMFSVALREGTSDRIERELVAISTETVQASS